MLNFNLTILIQMAGFLVFAWLFNLVFFKPVTAHLDARNRFLVDQQAKADALLKEAQAIRDDHERKLKEAQREAQASLDAAVRQAQARRGEQLAQVQAEGHRLVAEAKEQLAVERMRLADDLRNEVGSMARAIASKVLGEGEAFAERRSPEGAQA